MISIHFLIFSCVLSVGVAGAEPSGWLAWPAGPLEARVALAEPIAQAEADRLVGGSIRFGRPGPDKRLEAEGALAIAGVRLEDDGRALVLLTDPHPTEAVYEIAATDDRDDGPRWRYDLAGVEATWTAEGAFEPAWTGWLPELDLNRARRLTAVSAGHREAFARLERPGTLTLRTLIELPEGLPTVTVEADRPFAAELGFFPMEAVEPGRAEAVAEAFGEPVELFVEMETGPDFGSPALAVSYQRDEENGEAVRVDRSGLVLPWAPPPMTAEEPAPEVPERLRGGDPARGETVFFGETAKCSACHRVLGRGEAVGPDLSDLGLRMDRAAMLQAIQSPSAAIAPEYLPYTVSTVDGRVVVGVVRADGAATIRIVDADAEETVLERSAIEAIRPVTTSIMPVGLAGAIGDADLADLLAFLETLRDERPAGVEPAEAPAVYRAKTSAASMRRADRTRLEPARREARRASEPEFSKDRRGTDHGAAS